MLRQLRGTLPALHRAASKGGAIFDPTTSPCWSSHIELIAGWCRKYTTRDFSAYNKVAEVPGYRQNQLKATSPLEDHDGIVDRIQQSTRDLEQGPIGKNLSSAEKRKFLINTLLDLKDSKEAVYGTLDAWVAFEQDFPLASIKQALVVLEKEEQWHRIVQVIKWMLSKGQGTTMRTYEQLIRALEKDNRAEEAHRFWEKKIGHDLHSVPWRFCDVMLGIYYRNNMLERLVKLFKELEAYGRKPPSKSIVRKVEDAYEMLGLLEEKNKLLARYNDLYNKPWKDDRKKGQKYKKAAKSEKAVDGSKQSEIETSEDMPVDSGSSGDEQDGTG